MRVTSALAETFYVLDELVHYGRVQHALTRATINGVLYWE